MPDRKPHTARSRATIPLVVAAVAALLTGIMVVAPGLFDGSGSGSAAESPPVSGVKEEPPAQTKEEREFARALKQLERREPGDPMARGETDAPVVMLAYSEFQCPFCGKFARDTEPVLVEKYVRDGTLRIEWRDFPYLGEESTIAAKAGRAAAAQDKFWEFQEAMYANQHAPNTGKLTVDYLTQLAVGLGVEEKRFRRDMSSPEVANAIDRDFQQGQSIGVTGTPAFLVNGKPIIGAQPTDVFEEAIEQAAADAR